MSGISNKSNSISGVLIGVLEFEREGESSRVEFDDRRGLLMCVVLDNSRKVRIEDGSSN